VTPDVLAAPAPPGVRAVFTTRVGGVSTGAAAGLNLGATGGDDPATVRENRRLLCADLGIDADRVTMGHQVHGAGVRAVDAPTRPGRFTGGLAGWPEGDGLVTDRPGIALVVLGADCLPVLAWRRDGTAVGAAHAGWRGLVEGVVEAMVAALGNPADVGVAVGPGIGPCCYPTGPVVRAAFTRRFGDAVVHGEGVDLARAARVALLRAGVGEEDVWDSGACTSCDPARWFSYRRDGARAGRQAGVVWMADGILGA
jgi:purine-nucleoside/S-methyl-5'-thioadenosine phosphorylase / adenosine deaminase